MIPANLGSLVYRERMLKYICQDVKYDLNNIIIMGIL